MTEFNMEKCKYCKKDLKWSGRHMKYLDANTGTDHECDKK